MDAEFWNRILNGSSPPPNLPPPPPSRPYMQQVNPYYMQQQSMDALAPMLMYQQYKQTGEIPQAQSSFQPYTPVAYTAESQPVAAISTAKQVKPTGGK